MSFITRYGTIFGLVPPTTGRLFWIAPAAEYVVDGRTYRASDNNDGLAPERAIRSINQFVTNATANAGDTAILLQGTHTADVVQAISKAGLTVLGVHSQGGRLNMQSPKVVITAEGQGNNIFNVTADDFELGYVELWPETVMAAIVFGTGRAPAAGVDGFYLHDCVVRLKGPASTSTVGVDFGARSTTLAQGGMSDGKLADTLNLVTAYIENCVFRSAFLNGPAIIAATCNLYVKGCKFMRDATWATQIWAATNASSFIMEDCMFAGFGGGALPIDGTDANAQHGSFVIQRSSFDPGGLTNVAKPLDNFTATSDLGTPTANYGDAIIGSDVVTMTATGSVPVVLTT